MKQVAFFALLACCCLCFALAPSDTKFETIEWDGGVEIGPNGELIALVPPVPGASDAGCKMKIIYDNGDGTPIVVEIKCDTLPTCAAKGAGCDRVARGQTEGGGTIYDCRCLK